MRSVVVVPVIVGTLGSITKKLVDWLGKLDITSNTAMLQKTAFSATARILRKVLDY